MKMHRQIATDTKLYITLKLTLVFGESRVGYLFIIEGGYPPIIDTYKKWLIRISC